MRRLADAAAKPTAAHWLGEIGRGRAFVTVGISHLTTSRRLGATATSVAPGSFQVDGAIPWVTAAPRADLLVTGAVMPDGRKILFALPTDRPGVIIQTPFALAALQASCTAEVTLETVSIDDSDLLAGPAPDVMSHPGAVGTAGLETSALALGQAHAALAALANLEPAQIDLVEPLDVLCGNWELLFGQLLAQARGEPDAAPIRSNPQRCQRARSSIDTGVPHRNERNRVLEEPSQPSAGHVNLCSFSSGHAQPRSPTLPSEILPAYARYD